MRQFTIKSDIELKSKKIKYDKNNKFFLFYHLYGYRRFIIRFRNNKTVKRK